MIRVLRIIARLNIGGPAIHVTLLTDRLDSARYASTLVAGTTAAGEGSYLELQDRATANVTLIPALGREIGAQDASALVALIKCIRRTRPHIVHTHTAKAGTLGRLAAWICRVPVIVHTYHGHVLHSYFSPLKTHVFVNIERALAGVSSQLIAVSPTVREDLLRLGIGVPERFSVVPLGFDLARFATAVLPRGELRRELGVADEAPMIGIVARLAPIKAHETFLHATRLLADKYPGIVAVIVGDGERREALGSLAHDLGLDARVRFLGWRRDLERIYADLDVVALTSRNEGSPVALIEAMAARRAVVSTAVGGVGDVVTDGVTGRLVAADQPAELAAAVGALLDDPAARARLGTAAQAAVLQKYDAGRLVADIDSLYSRLLREAAVGAATS